MATYHCSVKVGGKGKASGHAAYIAREGYYAERTGYEDLEATGHGNLPAWAEGEPALFWAAADRHERANGATYREIEIALPRELNPAQRQELVLDFIRQEIGARHAHQWAIHNPGAALAGGEQPHAHLQQHGHAARVDHRSLADQGIDRAPERHLGGRRVRQLAPEQREALLERREAEDELRQSQRELAPLDLAQHLHELTAAALQREQAEQAARMAEARAYCRQALDEFRAELVRQAERERALEAERERLQRLEAEREWLQRLEAERERPQRPEAEPAPLLEPLPAIGIGSPAFAERLQAALAETMERLQAQRERSPAQEPPPQRSRGFDMEP